MKSTAGLELEKLYKEYEEEALRRSEGDIPLQFVWGWGSPDSRTVLIGEAPGKDEVIQGRPFVGKAGKMLDAFLEGTGIDRAELYITNTIKYRLAREGKRPGTLANRPARASEVEMSAPFLYRELELLAPEAVVTLGNVPLKAVLKAFGMPEITVGEAHGRPMKLTSDKETFMLFPMYHPASVIYNRSLETQYKEDLKKFFEFFQKK